MSKLLTRIFLLSTIFFVSFNLPTKNNEEKTYKNNIIECAPAYLDNEIATDELFANFTPTNITRKDFRSLSVAEVGQIRYAINAMKALPLSDPTSWDYQVKIHGGLTSQNPVWGTCQHGNKYFLAWHRMYLYYFERILRSKMDQNPKLPKPALPFWNYLIQGYNGIPNDFINSPTTNSLYDAMRDVTYGIGTLFPYTQLLKGFDTAMNQSNFASFQIAIESAHGDIHFYVGKLQTSPTYQYVGDMNLAETAANDPLFFVHHANVDMLWERWLKMGDGHCNPKGSSHSSWLNKVFTFYDEKKKKKSIKIKDILNTKNLGYVYDTMLTQKPIGNCKNVIFPEPQKGILVSSKKVNTLQLVKPINQFVIDIISEPKEVENLYLELKNIKINKNPGMIEVYINANDTFNLNPEMKSYAGHLDLFTAGALNKHHGLHMDNVIRINLKNHFKYSETNEKNLLKIAFVYTSKNGLKVSENKDMDVVIEDAQVKMYLLY